MSTKNQTKPKTQSKKPEPKKTNTPSIKARIDALVDFEGGKTKAYASATIGDAFAVHGIRVMKGENGLYLLMPSRKDGEEYKDIFHTITTEAREELNKEILDAYEQKLQEEQSEQLDEGETQEPIAPTM